MRLSFIFGELFNGLRRNLSMFISVVLVTFVSLTFVGAAGILQLQINQMKGYWYDKVQVAVFLCNDGSTAANCSSGPVTKEQRDGLERLLNSENVSQYVNSFEFESQADAFKHFKEQFANSPIVDSVTADQLPSSFRVNLKDPEKYQVISETFSSQPGVESVVDQRQLLEKLFSAMNTASLVAIGVAVLMIVCAALLISTTIRLSAYTRRREIGIMRLVGASKWFIQMPFLLEGVLAAVLGAVLASGTVWAISHYFLTGYLAEQYKQTAFISDSQVLVLAPILIGLGIVLSAISSMLAIRKALKA